MKWGKQNKIKWENILDKKKEEEEEKKWKNSLSMQSATVRIVWLSVFWMSYPAHPASKRRKKWEIISLHLFLIERDTTLCV